MKPFLLDTAALFLPEYQNPQSPAAPPRQSSRNYQNKVNLHRSVYKVRPTAVVSMRSCDLWDRLQGFDDTPVNMEGYKKSFSDPCFSSLNPDPLWKPYIRPWVSLINLQWKGLTNKTFCNIKIKAIVHYSLCRSSRDPWDPQRCKPNGKVRIQGRICPPLYPVRSLDT